MRIKHYNHILATTALILIFVVFNTVMALAQIKVSGKVMNSTGHPMRYAEVELCNDSTVVQAVSTDSVGGYQMEIPSGRYFQNCRYAGSVQRGQAIHIIRDTTINIEFTKQIAPEEEVVSSGKPPAKRKTDVSAQQFLLRGKIINQEKQPVELANVLLLKDSLQTDAVLTDSLGVFTLRAGKGTYTLISERFGNKLFKKEIQLDHDTDLGDLEVNESVMLEGVTIEARKKLIERKVDRLIFNVENSIAASAGNGLDALRVTPGVKIQNEIVSIVGKSTVSVMIDDRMMKLSGKDLTDFLKSLNASDIKSIEVITNPPSKYQAEGNSGIINIRLKNIKMNSWSNTVSSYFSKATHPLVLLGNVFSYNKNKLTLGASINRRKGSFAPVNESTTYYPQQTWNKKYNRRDYTNYIRTMAALDYKLSKKISTGFQYNFAASNGPSYDNVLIQLNKENSTTIDSLLVTTGEKKEIVRLHTFNYHLIYSPDTITNKKLTFDFDFLNYQTDNSRIFNNNNYSATGEPIRGSWYSGNSIGNRKISNYSFDIDMEHPMKNFTFNYGGRVSFSKTDNDIYFFNLTSGTPVPDKGKTNIFSYEENVQALYFSGSRDVGKKLKTKIGLRLESTQTIGTPKIGKEDKNNYWKLFPTAYVSYDINKKHTINVNYGRRINRPPFDWLNPFRYYMSLYFYVEGNPVLQPSFSHNLEFNYTYNSNLTLQFYYNKLENNSGQVSFVDPNNMTLSYSKPVNYINSDILGVNLSYTFNLLKWWESLSTINYNYSSSQSMIPETNQNLKGNNASLQFDNTFLLTKAIGINIYYYYSFPGVYGLDKEYARSQLNLTLRLQLLKKKLEIALSGNDIFKTNRPLVTSYTNNVQINYNNYYDLRRFDVTVVYKFGNTKLKGVEYSTNEAQKRL